MRGRNSASTSPDLTMGQRMRRRNASTAPILENQNRRIRFSGDRRREDGAAPGGWNRDRIAEMGLHVRIFTLLSLVFLPMYSDAFPNGKVEASCASMVPSHGVDPQTTFPPYSLSFSSVNYTGILGFRVTLSKAPGGTDFKGFMIQARAPSGVNPRVHSSMARIHRPCVLHLNISENNVLIGGQTVIHAALPTHSSNSHKCRYEIKYISNLASSKESFYKYTIQGYSRGSEDQILDKCA
ncbi:unnamed protein product [Ranitomeya imitator]|uniref:Reelin domain-containing protein n=1 Tax=Ranitomeya imitator TaxID=111125 RepID=A0ABN9L467_9NEOB|nr:unnamed protein product [Ranitomeya imitator]